MESGNPMLLFRVYKLTLKQELIYSSANSDSEQSKGAAHTRLREKYRDIAEWQREGQEIK